MTVGAMLRSALTSGASKSGYRELEVLEENHMTYDRDHLVVPWDFLAEYGRHAAVDKRIGGTDAIVFLAQRDPEKFKKLEDYEPGATKEEVMAALVKTAKPVKKQQR